MPAKIQPARSSTAGKNFRFIDLFSGVGGFHHALSSPAFGGECVLAVDIDAKCRATYQSTWPKMPSEAIMADIREITTWPDGTDKTLQQISKIVPDHEVLCAGFPCQPFSKSGAQQGFLDQTRGTLFFDILRIIEAKKPKYLILENVRNLVGPRHTETWRIIIDSLRGHGYQVSSTPVILSPHELPKRLGGTPQSRDRVFILCTYVGRRKEKEQEPLIPAKLDLNWNPQDWNIADFLLDDDEIENLSDYILREDEEAWINAWQAFVKGIKSDSLPGFPIWSDDFKVKAKFTGDMPDWKKDFLHKNSAFYKENKEFIDDWLKKSWIKGQIYTVKDFPASRRKFEWQARNFQPKRKDRDLWKLTIHFRPSGIRVKPANYLPALVAITQTSIIGERRRRITPVEAGRLQGLPDWVFPHAGFVDSIAYKQAGNGVAVGVVKFAAAHLFAASGDNWGKKFLK